MAILFLGRRRPCWGWALIMLAAAVPAAIGLAQALRERGDQDKGALGQQNELSSEPLQAHGGDIQDLGIVTSGMELQRTLVFRNFGKEPIQIDNAKTGCGCITILPLATQIIDPGNTVPLNLLLKPPATSRRESHPLVITYNGGKQKGVVVAFTVFNELVLDREQIGGREIIQGERDSGTFRLHNRTPSGTFKIISWRSEHGTVQLSCEKDGRDLMCRWTTVAAAPGSYSDWLTLCTDSLVNPELRIQLSWNVVSPVRTEPGSVFWSSTRRLDDGWVSVKAFHRRGRDFRIGRFVYDSETYEVRAEQGGDCTERSREHRFDVRLTSQALDSGSAGITSFHFDANGDLLTLKSAARRSGDLVKAGGGGRGFQRAP